MGPLGTKISGFNTQGVNTRYTEKDRWNIKTKVEQQRMMLPLISDWCSGFMFVFGVWIGKGTWSHSEENRNATSKMGYHGATLALALVWASPNSQELPLILTTYLCYGCYLLGYTPPILLASSDCWHFQISNDIRISICRCFEASTNGYGKFFKDVLSENFTCIPYHSMYGIFIMYLHLLDFLWHQWVDVYIRIYTLPVPWIPYGYLTPPFFIAVTAGT